MSQSNNRTTINNTIDNYEMSQSNNRTTINNTIDNYEMSQSNNRTTINNTIDNYEMSQSNNRTTINNTIEHLNKIIDEIEGRQIDLFKTKEKKIKNYINTVFEKEWTKKINNSSKSDTYKLFKLKPSMEKYLKDTQDNKIDKNMNKI